MINNYLKLLLADNKRVIIPDFGGFVVKRSAAGDIISFNSFLKFNDDLLVNMIVEKEDLDKAQALKQIKELVADINTALDEEGRYEIKDLGFLMKDKKDNIRFMLEMDEVTTTFLPSDTKERKEREEPSINSTKTVVENDNAKKSKEQKESVTEESVNNTQEEMKNKNVVPEATEVRSRDKKKVILWAVLLLVVVALVVWAFFSLGNRDKVSELATTEVVEVVNQTVYAMQANQVDTISGILVVADRDISPMGEERYNVIIGSFTESKNAVQFNKSLINEGYASELFERYNGFQAVSMGAYPSLDIALKVSGEALIETPDVWILVK